MSNLQSRQPAGSPDGGQFTSSPAGAEAETSILVIAQARHLDIDAPSIPVEADGYGNWRAYVPAGPEAAEDALYAIRRELIARDAMPDDWELAARRHPAGDRDGLECWVEAETTDQFVAKTVDRLQLDAEQTTRAQDPSDPYLDTLVAEGWDAWEGVPDTERADFNSWASLSRPQIEARLDSDSFPLEFDAGTPRDDRFSAAAQFEWLKSVYEEQL